MVNLKNKSAVFFTIIVLKKVLVILGCLSFLFSLMFPFYHESMVAIVVPASRSEICFWSYKIESSYLGGQYDYWLSDYWFSLQSAWGLETSWILVSTFTIQLLTLALGLVPIRINRRTLFFAPVLLTSTIAVLMTGTGKILEHPIVPMLQAFSAGYQLGYYLVYPSIAMFLFAFLLNEVTKMRQTTSRSIPVIESARQQKTN
jgi:hypothetical protein